MTYPRILVHGRVLEEVDEERAKQDVKWGEQNHPDGVGPDQYLVQLRPGGGRYICHAGDAADVARQACQEADEDGTVTWRHIFLEEAFEAVASGDLQMLREELVQVAAVAVAWIEAIDRRG